MSDATGRSSRWMPATGDHSDGQLHAMEFIASSLDRIDGHLERIAGSLAGSGAHKPFGEALGEQLRSLGETIARTSDLSQAVPAPFERTLLNGEPEGL